MAKGKTTPAAQRKRRKIQQKKRKKLARKRSAKAPSWVAAVQRKAIERTAEEGLEVQGEIDPAIQERFNKLQPTETQLFLTGLPQEATDQQLKDYFKNFGEVRRVLLVRNRTSSLPSGSAFVHFGSPSGVDAAFSFAQQNAQDLTALQREEAQAVVKDLTRHQAKKLKYKTGAAQAQKRDPFVEINHERVTVHRVMTRTDAEEFFGSMIKKKKNTKVAQDDARNLYLLQEGVITEDSPAARGLAPAYLRMLRQDYETRRAQLRDVNFFVSKVRLSFRNVPRTFSPADLRKLVGAKARQYYRKHPEMVDRSLWGEHGPIKGVKILTDANGASKGYGFVEFASHDVALYVLRQLNNNPDIFGPSHRLVVSFAIENMLAIQRHQHRKEMKAENRKRGRQDDDDE